MKTNINTIIITALISLAILGCKKKNDPSPENPTPPSNDETELITTIKLTLHDTTTHAEYTYAFSDVDGTGGNPALYGGTNQSDSVITLLANHIYKCDILLLDESKTPIDTISKEVKEKDNEHLFFFNAINPSGTPPTVYLGNSMTTIKYLDSDNNNLPVGLSTLWISPSMPMSKSLLRVTLRHQPNAKDGTYAPGETDIQVDFKLEIN